MAEPKTRRSAGSVTEFLDAVADPRRRADAIEVCALIADTTGAEPEMWGSSIVGFGTYHYKYASGREGDWPAVGLSPRKAALTLYLSTGFAGSGELLGRLGSHSLGKSCLYVIRLSDIDQSVLRELIGDAYRNLNGRTVTG
jgi:hypothetical protein